MWEVSSRLQCQIATHMELFPYMMGGEGLEEFGKCLTGFEDGVAQIRMWNCSYVKH